MEDITEIICCPRCRGKLRYEESARREQYLCVNDDCKYSKNGFSIVSGQPVLIDFDSSIVSNDFFHENSGQSHMRRDNGRTSIKSRIRRLLFGTNSIAVVFSRRIIEQLKDVSTRPRILVIGGGAKGSGTEPLYADNSIDLVGTDIYASPYTQVISDAHQLPFLNESFDGVWIQAVLEHVLDPPAVVDEIHRVLKPGGIVYADTPFIQQVHEQAYDFTRFTLSGHRWLFRRFEEIDSVNMVEQNRRRDIRVFL